MNGIKKLTVQTTHEFEGHRTAFDFLDENNTNQDSRVMYEATSPIYKGPHQQDGQQSCTETSRVSLNEMVIFSEILLQDPQAMNFGYNSQFDKSQSPLESSNVHDRETTMNVNTNFDSNTDGIYTDIKQQVSF